jgi:hypothetical protein
MSNQFIIEENEVYGDFHVYELSTYEESSVLAGQEKKVFMEVCETVEEAKKEYPTAEVRDSIYKPIVLPMSDCPPSWFDESNAGETW